MEKRVTIDPFQKVTNGDLQNMSLFPEASLDDVVADIGITGQGFSGFPVVQSAPAEVTVGNGRFYQAGRVYFNDTSGGQKIDLLGSLPLVTMRFVAIVTWGASVDANVEPRTFLTDPITRASVARAKSTERWRWANLSAVNGVEGPDPIKPAVASNVCVVAWVVLDTLGIVSINMEPTNMVPSVTEADTRLNDVDAWRATAGSILATLRSDISAIAAKFAGLAQLNLVLGISRDVSRLKEKAKLPDAYSAYGSSSFINESQSDTTNVDYLARVEEGLNFAYAAVQNDQLGLLNPLDPGVISTSNFILPKYIKSTRISQIGTDLELNVSNYQYQTVTWTKWPLSRFRMRTGAGYIPGGSQVWAYGNPAGQYESIFGLAGDPTLYIEARTEGGWPAGAAFARNSGWWYDAWNRTYWRAVTSTSGVSGSIVAETFLNAQAGYLLEVGFYFSRVAASGDVHVAICKTVNGAPDLTNVIASTDILLANLRVSSAGATPVRSVATFQPTYLNAGDRYAIVLMTSGNHYLWQTKNNKYTDGSFFTSTDGAWFLGDTVNDIAFDLVFAQFTAPRAEIQLLPLQLAGGIVGVDVCAAAAVPGGTSLIFQVQQAGVWYNLDGSYLLTGLPALLPFRAVFNGTSQVMPQLGLLSNSRVSTNRPRADYTHISTVLNTPSTTSIRVYITARAWRDTNHTILCKILSGTGYATITTPATTTTTTPPDDTGARDIVYVFTLSPAVTTFKLKLTGTTDNVVTPYIVSERIFVAT